MRSKSGVAMIWSLCQRFGVMAVTFVTNVVLSRLLSPDDFGTIGMLLIFLSISNTFVDGGFAAALVQKKDASDRDFSTIFYWNLCVSVVLVVILLFCAPYVAKFYNIPLLCDILRVQSLILLINAFSIVQQNILIKTLQFKKLAVVNLLGQVIGATVGITMAYMEFGVWCLVWKNLIAALCIAILFWVTTSWRPQWVFDVRSFCSLGKFGGMVLLANLVETLYVEIQGLIIGRVYSARDLGYYTQAKRLEEVPTLGLSTAVNQVAFPVLSKMQDDVHLMRDVVSRNMRVCSMLVFPLYGLLIFLAPVLISFLFTEKWLPSVPYFRILCLAGVVYAQCTIGTNVVKALGRGQLYFNLQLLKRVGIIFIVGGMYCGGIYGLAFGVVAAYYVMFLMNAVCMQRLIGYRVGSQIKDVGVSGGIAVASALLAQSLGQIVAGGIWGKGLLFLISYLILICIFQRQELRRLLHGLLKQSC